MYVYVNTDFICIKFSSCFLFIVILFYVLMVFFTIEPIELDTFSMKCVADTIIEDIYSDVKPAEKFID